MPWSPSQYVKFEDERTRPARDLLAQVPLERVTHGIDLGCGPGNSTELLIERYGAKAISGLDGDENMVEAARKRLPDTQIMLADLLTWRPSEPQDLMFANAVFQWLPNHLDIFDRLMDRLAPGGVLAVQMPDNLDEPSHLLMEESAQAGPWRNAFAKPARRAALPKPSAYYDRLIGKSVRVDIWHTIYNHPMDGAPAIVEWVKSTGLRTYLDRIAAERQAEFLEDYTARIAKAYPRLGNGKVLFRFPRLFFVAVKR
ncbi:trans-aconitate 2-methyltransferase [Rhizobium sp. KVB221]|uniref:Trans-aconitate 2-methyltransferase n=1 Tax=Rhizobium setariae TaxID=2801340 RepID=A0A936YJU7_9HYPH|nr:trans-aconitate 2-methyltransferase [Rhizobium setariae]MBL0371620.1 trans-aconitate 2-methyltransferase [Rhizobium setariae]